MDETTRPAMPVGIAKRLVAAQRKARAVAKDSRNEHHRYAYASAEAIIEEARGALGDAGLACFPHGWHVVPATEHDDARIVLTYLVVSDDGETWESAPVSTPVIPDKGRPSDKAEATALTYSLGYFLRGLLLLPRGTEGTDADQRDDKAHEPKRPPVDKAQVAADMEALLADFGAGNAVSVKKAETYLRGMRARGVLTASQDSVLGAALDAAHARLSGNGSSAATTGTR